MKKVYLFGLGLCAVLACTSCKSSKESAYKKAYEKAQQQELATAPQPEQQAPVEVVTPVVAPEEPKVVESAPVGTRQEKVTVVSGDAALKRFSVVCGAFSVKANAEGVKQQLTNDGYAALVVFNAERNLYRVVVSTFDDRASAEQSRDSFKARYPQNEGFQGAWLLYNVD